MFGFLNINKDAGMTSHKVISLLRKITGIKQIGHAGTLDPIASGVLPVAIGKASKLIDYLPTDKRYIAGLYLGKKSDTYDTDGIIIDTNSKKVTLKQIEEILPLFRGTIKQIPPAFSAVHYNGKRLYELARKGKIPEDIPSREITIYSNNIVDFDYEKQVLKLDISCSKGTYIRTIVNDIGECLGSGAVMYSLKRTLSSGMEITNSLSISETTTKEIISTHIINPQDVLTLEKTEINEDEYKYVLNGNKFKNNYSLNGTILLLKNKQVIALADADSDFIQPKKVLL